MMQKKNKGVTLIEVLIALAIFLVLMVPLVSSLVTSIKTTDSAKETQNRNEYAQVLMENIKNAPIDDLKNSATVGAFFTGSENVTTGPDSTDPTNKKKFEIKGSTYLGTQHDKYSYIIRCENIERSDTYGIMEDLDPTKVAIMPVTFSNYDDVAIESIITQRMSDEVSSRLSADDNGTIFKKDSTDKDTVSGYRTTSAARYVNISVSGTKSAGFDVSYQLMYRDVDSGKYVTYNPYRQHFKNIPNLYLMYNNGVYNDKITSDSISYSLSGVDFSDFADNERINAFVIRTADDYGKILDNYKKEDGTYDNARLDELTSKLNELFKNRIKEDFKDSEGNYNESAINSEVNTKGTGSKVKNNSSLLFRKDKATYDRNSLNVSIGESTDTTDHFRVYHNLFKTDGSGNKVSMVNADTYLSRVFSDESKALDSLEKAHEEIWNIYSVKVWMQEGEIADVDTKPELITLQGTRGGGEIE